MEYIYIYNYCRFFVLFIIHLCTFFLIDYWKDGTLPSHMVNQMKILWTDEGIQRCFRRSNEYRLNDSASYFLHSLERIEQKDYVPSMKDVLRTRARTTGVVEVQFFHKVRQFLKL